MEQARKNLKAALNKPRLILVALINTMWAVGTSAVAGALSA